MANELSPWQKCTTDTERIVYLQEVFCAVSAERDVYKAALEKISRLPYDEVPDHHQSIALDALSWGS